ncbi:MAG: hypothetical protein SOZ27_05530 [Spirochaetia bacterium]|nr:hypothetical protein [Spirochaetia bacterium]
MRQQCFRLLLQAVDEVALFFLAAVVVAGGCAAAFGGGRLRCAAAAGGGGAAVAHGRCRGVGGCLRLFPQKVVVVTAVEAGARFG